MAKFSYKDYKESDKVKQYASDLQTHNANKPAEWAGGTYGSAVTDAMDKIQNREKFSYDLNSDALYQQYKNQYINQGRLAMMDTTAQASAMTGGYGNSYAATAGNQAYQTYLQGLNDVVPELYQMAYDRYNQEGQDLLNNYSMLNDQYNQEYGRYQDALSQYNANRDYLANLYNTERNYDYSLYSDGRDFAYSDYRNQVADEQWQKDFAEAQRQYNESLAEQKRQHDESLAEQKRQYDTTMAYNQSKASYSGSSGGSGGSSDDDDVVFQYKNLGYESYNDAVGKLKTYAKSQGNDALQQTLYRWLEMGYINQAAANSLYGTCAVSDNEKTLSSTVEDLKKRRER